VSASLTLIARRFNFVRETEGPNAGYWVDYFLRYTGNVEGESWCAAFTSKVTDIAYKGKSPLLRSGSTIAQLHDARTKGLVVTTPAVDDLYFFLRPDGTPHHTGIVTGLSPLTGIAGNTSSLGNSDNGTGVFEHAISATDTAFVRLPP
jgi:hypothetical protein